MRKGGELVGWAMVARTIEIMTRVGGGISLDSSKFDAASVTVGLKLPSFLREKERLKLPSCQLSRWDEGDGKKAPKTEHPTGFPRALRWEFKN